MIDINFKFKPLKYNGHMIDIRTTRMTSFGNAVTYFWWEIQSLKSKKKTQSKDNFSNDLAALNNAKYWIDEYLTLGKDL